MSNAEPEIERRKDEPENKTTNPGKASLDASLLAISDHPVPEEGKEIKLDVSKVCSDVTRSLIPALTPLGLGASVILFHPTSGVPLTYASTTGDPDQFIFTLSRLLKGADGMKPLDDEPEAEAEAPASGEITKTPAPDPALNNVQSLVPESKKHLFWQAFIFAVIAAVAVLLSGCSSIHIGAKAPTDKTYLLSADTITIAANDDCRQDWVSGNPTVDLITAKRILKDKKIEVVEGNPKAAATSLADDPSVKLGLLVVKKGFWKESEAYQTEYLSHEFVHYCDLERLGADYEITWATSNGRWTMETRAYAQSFRTKAAQGVPKMDLREAIDHRLESMRNFYWLWDIDPDQYMAETKDIWLKAAGV